MLKVTLSGLAALAAFLSVSPLVRAPGTKTGWLLTLVVGEYGHWLVLLPVAVALAAVRLEGAWKIAIWVACGLAIVGMMRPTVSAWRLAGRDFSWVRLYRGDTVAKAAVRTETYARPAGRTLTLDVYSPPTVGGSIRHPVLLVIHGGGWDGGDNQQLIAWNHRWASQGWLVVTINYRLAPEFPWPAQREDVAAAMDWVKRHAERLGADAERVVLLGRSAGGQIATACAYGARDQAIVGVIALYAPHDMRFAWSVSREDDALNSIKLLRQYFGGPPDTPERAARYDSASGQLLARPDSPPTLLLHGYPDTLVWHRHSARLAAHLREIGVPVIHRELPWATHAFDLNPHGPAGQIADAEIERFLAKIATGRVGK